MDKKELVCVRMGHSRLHGHRGVTEWLVLELTEFMHYKVTILRELYQKKGLRKEKLTNSRRLRVIYFTLPETGP